MNTSRPLRLVIFCAAALFASAALAQNGVAQGAAYVPGELLIKFMAQAPAADILNARRGVGASEVQQFANIGVRHWRLGEGVSVEQALNILAAPGLQRWIEYAEPNFLQHAVDLPNDPEFARLWGLYNGGQTGGTKGADVHAVEAWLAGFIGTQNIVVGVIDTGIDYNHPDLAANIWVNPGETPGNGIDDDGNGYIDDVHGFDFANNDNDPLDDNGHGSHVSGTIGGVGNNGLGVAGVNWQVRFMALKFLDAGGSGSTANAIKAVNYAANKQVRITNNSWGGGGKSKAMQDAIKNAGALFVAAAGNSGSSSLFYPAAYVLNNVLAVAATDHNDQVAWFSNYGNWVHLAAPGVGTFSTFAGGGYATLNGTSMATPHVSGAAALVMAYNAALNIVDVKSRLLQTVDALPSLSGKVSTSGRLNVQKAVGAPTPAVPIVYFAKSKLTSDSNNNGWAEPGETVQLTVTLGNLRFAAAAGVSATLSANSVFIGTQNLGNIAPDGSVETVFTFAIDSGASSGQTLNFTLDISLSGTPHRSAAFSLTLGVSDVLLVNDAGAYEPFYTQALQANGSSYQVMRTSDEIPSADEMSKFKAVIWFTGDDASDTFTAAEQQEVAKYLDGQGQYPNPPRMFVTGQDIGFDLVDDGSDRLFYETYFHARYITDYSDIYDLAGVNDPFNGLTISIPLNSGDGARNQWFQDEIAAISPAAPILNYSGDGQGAVKYESGALRLIYFGFGFEAIDSSNPSTAPRSVVLKRVLDWLLESPGDGNFAPVPVVQTEQTVVAVAPDTSVVVTLNGSTSYDVDGTIVQYAWFDGATPLSTDPVIALPLEFGVHQVTLTVTDNAGKTGSSTVQISVVQQLFADDMESSAQLWTTQGNDRDTRNKNLPPSPGASNLWHKSARRGSDAGHSPVTSWYYGIEAQGNYDTGIRNWGRLISPAITLPSSQNGSRTELHVSQLVNVEGGTFENAIIQISTNGGNSWTELSRRGNRFTSFVADIVDLSSYMGQTVHIGFFIDTRDRTWNTYEGWYVDDVSVTVLP